MPFQKGQKKPPGSGRKKGTPNVVTQVTRAALSSLLNDALGEAQRRDLVKQLEAGDLVTLIIQLGRLLVPRQREELVEREIPPDPLDFSALSNKELEVLEGLLEKVNEAG